MYRLEVFKHLKYVFEKRKKLSKTIRGPRLNNNHGFAENRKKIGHKKRTERF